MSLKNWKEIPLGGMLTTPGSSKEYKTGSWRGREIPVYDKKKCTQCLTCANFCPENCIKITEDGKISHIDYAYCKGCGICAHECPAKAIIMKKSC